MKEITICFADFKSLEEYDNEVRQRIAEGFKPKEPYFQKNLEQGIVLFYPFPDDIANP
jgi:hypothetical protein